VTIGIILTGILALYILFILVQIKTLFTNALPIDFAQTENLVKTGFWQLFALTVLNIFFFAGIYKKSTKIIQGILAVFTFSSLLLIISAAQRVYLYVTDYGLSYEKFFAFYTVVYCGIVFVWFLLLFIGRDRDINIIRKLVFMALWMYAITTVMPLDSIIFSTNLRLTQQPKSRVNINDLTMLGFDTLPLVEENFELLIKEARKDYLSQNRERRYSSGLIGQQNYTEEEYLKHNVDLRWLKWVKQNIDKQIVLRKNNHINCYGYLEEGFDEECKKFEFSESQHQQKMWYEKTFSELLYEPEVIKVKFELLKHELFEKKSIRTFKNDIHGFAFDYDSDLKIDFDDFYNVSEITKRKSWKITISDTTSINDENHEMFFYIFNNEQDISIASCNNYDNLPNKQNTRACHIYQDDMQRDQKKKMRNYKLLIKLPKKQIAVASHKVYDIVPGVWAPGADEEYIDAIAPTEKLRDVLKSFRTIDIREY
jgi:hypothetical protein